MQWWIDAPYYIGLNEAGILRRKCVELSQAEFFLEEGVLLGKLFLCQGDLVAEFS